MGDTSIAQSAAPDEEVDEPEDDYNAAWEVLDVARTIYARMVEGKQEGEAKEERLCLAECYLALGDVSCETGKWSVGAWARGVATAQSRVACVGSG